jgi:hypothetical protein
MMHISNYPSGIKCQATDDTGLEIPPEMVLLFLAYFWGKAGRRFIDKIISCADHDGFLTIVAVSELPDDEACLVSDAWHAFGGDDYLAFAAGETVA